MRKKQFGRLLTISLSDEWYSLVEKIANVYQTSMGAVIRDSIKYSVDQKGAWSASKPRPFDADKTEREPVKDVQNINVTGKEENEKDER